MFYCVALVAALCIFLAGSFGGVEAQRPPASVEWCFCTGPCAGLCESIQLDTCYNLGYGECTETRDYGWNQALEFTVGAASNSVSGGVQYEITFHQPDLNSSPPQCDARVGSTESFTLECDICETQQSDLNFFPQGFSLKCPVVLASPSPSQSPTKAGSSESPVPEPSSSREPEPSRSNVEPEPSASPKVEPSTSSEPEPSSSREPEPSSSSEPEPSPSNSPKRQGSPIPPRPDPVLCAFYALKLDFTAPSQDICQRFLQSGTADFVKIGKDMILEVFGDVDPIDTRYKTVTAVEASGDADSMFCCAPQNDVECACYSDSKENCEAKCGQDSSDSTGFNRGRRLASYPKPLPRRHLAVDNIVTRRCQGESPPFPECQSLCGDLNGQWSTSGSGDAGYCTYETAMVMPQPNPFDPSGPGYLPADVLAPWNEESYVVEAFDEIKTTACTETEFDTSVSLTLGFISSVQRDFVRDLLDDYVNQLARASPGDDYDATTCSGSCMCTSGTGCQSGILKECDWIPGKCCCKCICVSRRRTFLQEMQADYETRIFEADNFTKPEGRRDYEYIPLEKETLFRSLSSTEVPTLEKKQYTYCPDPVNTCIKTSAECDELLLASEEADPLNPNAASSTKAPSVLVLFIGGLAVLFSSWCL